jgi:amino acid transporter
VLTLAKRVLIGRPIATSEQEHQRLPKVIALATFSSDAISSTAYATEEILFVIAAGSSSLALGLSKLVPIAIVVAVLLAIVSFSYRQTIYAYPSGGGSYIVSRENLGELPSLVAGSSLLVDYILTVAVSISSGVAALVSIPSLRGLADERVLVCLGFVALVTIANLRGVKESGRIFAVPTYIYVVSLGAMLVIGLARTYLGHVDPVPFDPANLQHIAATGGTLSLFLLLRGFSSGAVALSGVEAISNGVPAFKRPESRNAANTLTAMSLILGTLFLGTAVLAHHLQPYPNEHETVISQMARQVVGNGLFYWVLQLATAAILLLAANTAYADFPRLSSIIAKDGFLPRQFANLGDRLVFSNGVIFLAVAASVLIVAFGGLVNALIPLYAIGVFTAFTLSQAGMVVHHFRVKEPNWRFGAVVNGTGSFATFVVALIVAGSKFEEGAWIPIVLVPLVISLFKAINRHYRSVDAALAIEPEDVPPPPARHTFVVLVGRVNRGVVEAINHARSLRPDHLTALHVAADDADHAALHREWERFGFDVPLEIVDSPYRELTEPVEAYLDALGRRWQTDRVTVVIPELVVGVKSVTNVLHGQNGLALKLALLDRPDTAVLSVPFHLRAPSPERPAAAPPAGDRAKPRLTASRAELEAARLSQRFRNRPEGAVAIAQSPVRTPVRLTGEVTASRVVPRDAGPSLEVTVNDGTGEVLTIFTGRRRVAGLDLGRAVTLEGVIREEDDRRVLVNPVYTLR